MDETQLPIIRQCAWVWFGATLAAILGGGFLGYVLFRTMIEVYITAPGGF